MGLLKNNITIGWYGECNSCKELDLYNDANVKSQFENLILVIQISESGFVYKSWSQSQHKKQMSSWDLLPELVKNSLTKLEYIKSGQSITKLKCGTPYIIEIQEGTELNIDGFTPSGSLEGDSGRVIDCYECPKYPPCVCE